MREMHERTFDRFFNAAQMLVQAIDVQKAGKDLGFNLPFRCYLNDRSQLDEWIEQQSK
jgi:hypothetical protein